MPERGPILVGHRCLLAADGWQATDGFVDLGPFRGTRIRLALKGVRTVLGCDLPVVHALIDEGALVEDLSNAGKLKRYVWIDPGVDLGGLYDQWMETFPTPSDYAGWQRYKDMRHRCRIPTDQPIEDRMLEAAADFLLEMGTVKKHELQGLLECNVATERSIMTRIRRTLRRHRRQRATGEPIDLETFRSMLPEAIARAPETCFAPLNGDLYDPPSPAILGRLSRLGPFFEAGSLFIMRKAATARREHLVRNHMRSIERLDELLSTAGREPKTASDGAAVTRILDRYALERDLLEDDVPAVVDLTARAWHEIHDDLVAYVGRVSEHDRPLAKALGRHVPAAHQRRSGFADALTERFGMLRDQGRERRKGRSDPIADNLGRLSETLRLRMVQLSAVADEAHDVAEELRASGADHIDFGVRTPILHGDGRLEPGEQTVHLRCWSADAMARRLAADEGGAPMTRRLPGRPRAGETRTGRSIRDVGQALGSRLAKKSGGPVHFIEYIGTRAADPEGGEAIEPWFVTLLRVGTIVRPAYLSVAMREERRRLILDWGLPGYEGTPAGLLGFDREGSFMFRKAAEAGLCILPIEEFDHLMRIAHLGYSLQTETTCRGHEALQVCSPSAEDRWVPRIVDDCQLYAFKAVPKQSAESGDEGDAFKEVEFLLEDETLERIVELEKVAIRRGGGDETGESAQMVEPSWGSEWKCARQRYLMSRGDRAIDIGTLNVGFRYRAAGIADMRSHDLRHASANARRRAGATTKELAEDMNQTTLKQASYYGRPTGAQRGGKEAKWRTAKRRERRLHRAAVPAEGTGHAS